MEIGVSSYSFSGPVRSGAMEQVEVIAAAKKIGFDRIEFSTIHLPPGASLPDYARTLAEEAERHGVRIVNYAIGADFLTGSGGDLEAEIARVEREVDIAVLLGSPRMRHDASTGWPPASGGPKTFAAALPSLAEGCRRVADYAAAQGVETMVENHGWFCQESSRIEQLVSAVNHPNFGLLLDVGNFLCVDEDPLDAVGRLADLAVHCHVKDFHVKRRTPHPGIGWIPTRGGNHLRGAILGHGEVPFDTALHILARSGYDGVVSLEFEGIEETNLALTAGLATLTASLP